MKIDADLLDWLLAGDPAIRWQVERDLVGSPRTVWETTRKRVTEEGWGSALLSHRAADGTWGGGLYSPKWVSTFYTLLELRDLGVDAGHPAIIASCRSLLDVGVADDGSVRLWKTPSTDMCVTAMLLSMAVSFGLSNEKRCSLMAGHVLGGQMPDGGWNCQFSRSGATHGSFHTTISVLEALQAWSNLDRGASEALDRGHEFLLVHELFRSHRTGEVVRPSMTRFSFPCRWYYDVLRGLEHLRAADVPWDARLDGAIELVERKRRDNGRWPLQNRHPGLTWHEMEIPGKPSRWNTLRALRVLDWGERSRSGP